jgi:hypothetical protein
MTSEEKTKQWKCSGELLLSLSLLSGGVSFVFFGIVVNAIWKIMSTTPFMGIQVDGLGNPLPVQGYPQMYVGLIGMGFLIVLTIAFGLLARGRFWERGRL